MTITLTYTTSEGKEEQVEYNKDVETIKLELMIQNIDLAPLSSCTNLHKLDLKINQLQDIDLTHLSSCITLHTLDLRGGYQLQNIDLAPLSSCINLQKLLLDNNKLQNIDLAPLSSCINLQKLFLSDNKLPNIDLAPLSSCINLQGLDLRGNQLQNIDLTPLNSCTNLEFLDLGNNQLQDIDLAPLSSCINLQQLWLGNNPLQTSDLNPLSSCINLYELFLAHNQLQYLELSPLSFCTNLKRLDLGDSKFQNIDLVPLSSCTNLKILRLSSSHLQEIDVTPVVWVNRFESSSNQKLSSWLQPFYINPRNKGEIIYSSPFQLYPWSFLHKIIEQFKNDYRILHDILAALDLADYGFIDRDLTDTLLAIAPETSTEDIREILIKFLVEEITAAVDMNGPTTGFNVESLVSKHGEIATRAQRIIELRKREIEQIRIHIRYNVVDLRELWLTAYGSKILDALGMRLTTDSGGLEQIKRAFAELGHKLKIGDSPVSSVDMSNELKESIWWIADNRGKNWSEIEKQGA